MKRIAAVLVLVLVALTACAQTKTVVGNSITVTWDAPALGDIPPAQISYEVMTEVYPSGAQVLVGTATSVEQSITFTVDGSTFKIGVRTKRTTATGEVLYSDWLWSDVAGTPQPWYVVYFKSPDRVLRVRIK